MAAHSQTHRDDADDDDDDDEDEDEDEGEDEGEDDAASMGAAAVFVVGSSTSMIAREPGPTTMMMMIRSQSRMKVKETQVKYAPSSTFLLFG